MTDDKILHKLALIVEDIELLTAQVKRVADHVANMRDDFYGTTDRLERVLVTIADEIRLHREEMSSH
jgi:ribosomal protein S15P/S13E